MKQTIAVLVLVGCGSGSGSNMDVDAGMDDAAVDAFVPTRTVSGVARTRRVTPAGEVSDADDLSTMPIAAIVGSKTYPGTGDAQGMFSIPNVPVGNFHLQFGGTYLARATDTIDLSSTTLGHRRPALTQPSTVTFNVTQLAAWSLQDELQLFSQETGLAAYEIDNAATSGVPTQGATALSSFVFDLSRSSYRPAIAGAMGDRLTLTQLATQTVDGKTFRALIRGFTAPAFDLANGGSATVSGTFDLLIPQNAVSMTFDRAAFDGALRAQVPGLEPQTYPQLALSTLPEAAAHGFYHSAPDLFVFEPGYTADTTPVSTAMWSFRDPFPTTWTRIASARFYAYRYLQIDTRMVPVYASIEVDRLASSITPGGSITPRIGPVRNVRVNGVDAYAAQAGVGLSPTLAWTAPEIGAADRYYVNVRRVVVGSTETSLATIAIVESKTPSLTIPSGILTAGQRYVFEVFAQSTPNSDFDATPFVESLPSGRSRITTNVIAP